MKVGRWIERFPGAAITVAADTPLASVLDAMLAQTGRRDAYVLAADGRVAGHLGFRRLAELFLAEHRPENTRRQLMERIAGGVASDFMSAQFSYARQDEDLYDVLHRQLEHRVEDLPVLGADGRLLGTVNLSAVLAEFRRRSHGGDDET